MWFCNLFKGHNSANFRKPKQQWGTRSIPNYWTAKHVFKAHNPLLTNLRSKELAVERPVSVFCVCTSPVRPPVGVCLGTLWSIYGLFHSESSCDSSGHIDKYLSSNTLLVLVSTVFLYGVIWPVCCSGI